MLEPKGVVRFDIDFALGFAAAEIAINVSSMMVDDHDDSPGLACLSGCHKAASLFQEPAQTRYLLQREIVGAGALEESSLGADHECELVVSVRLHLANLPNQIDD